MLVKRHAGGVAEGVADDAIPNILDVIVVELDLITTGGDGVAAVILAIPDSVARTGGILDVVPKCADERAAGIVDARTRDSILRKIKGELQPPGRGADAAGDGE